MGTPAQMLESAQNAVQGLPVGAVVRPLPQRIAGLPAGATLRPLPAATADKSQPAPAGVVPGMAAPTGRVPAVLMKPETVSDAVTHADAPQRSAGPATIAAHEPTAGENVKRALFGGNLGAAINETMPGLAEHLGITGLGRQTGQVLQPEELFQSFGRKGPADPETPEEAVMKGVGRAAGHLTTGENLAMMAGAGMLPEWMAGVKGEKFLQSAIAGGFTTQMVGGLYQGSKQFKQQMDSGDRTGALETLGELGTNGVLAFLAGKHAVDSAKGAASAPDAKTAPDTANLAPKSEPNQPAQTNAGRPVLQGSSDPAELAREAKAKAPALKQQLQAAVNDVPGAALVAVRDEKSPERVDEKASVGKPVETQPDHLAARITADTPEAKDALAQKLAGQGEVQREDRYAASGGPNEFRADTHQVTVNDAPGAALKTAEVQVLTPEQHAAAEDTHDLYEKQRTAAATGNKALAFKLAQQLRSANKGAADAAADRQQSAAAESKYKFGSTQADLPEGSDAHGAVNAARERIDPADLAGKGLDVGDNHVTVRYGVQGGDPEKLRQYLQQQQPFVAKLGKTAAFPPTENSDGAAVIHAPVESDDLHRMNDEIQQHAQFAPSSFPDYKPHVTVAYVKPDAAKKYTGMDLTEGKSFPVNAVSITDRNGNAESVPLQGKAASQAQTTQGAFLRPPKPPQKGKTWETGTPVLVRDADGVLKPGSVAHFNHGENGAPRRARVTLADGGKLDGVKEEHLLRIAPLDDPKPLTNTPQEASILARTQANGPKLVQEYVQQHTKDGVLEISTDAAKELFPEFKSDPIHNEPDVHVAAGLVRNALVKTVMSSSPHPGKPVFMIETASPGSGKSTAMANTNDSEVGLKMEAIFRNQDHAKDLIQKAISSGREPVIAWTYVDDPAKTVDRMLQRALGTPEKPGIGRTTALDYMADAYYQVPRAVQALRDTFGNRIRVIAKDNSGAPGDLKVHADPTELLDKAIRQPYNGIKRAIYDRFAEQSKDPKFANPRGQAILKAASATRGDHGRGIHP